MIRELPEILSVAENNSVENLNLMGFLLNSRQFNDTPSLLHQPSNSSHICHPRRKDSCYHRPERLGYFAMRVSILRSMFSAIRFANAGGALPLGKDPPFAIISLGRCPSMHNDQVCKAEEWKNTPTILPHPFQILSPSHHIFQLTIMRMVDIHVMFREPTVEEINHNPNRDLAQPEVVRREER